MALVDLLRRKGSAPADEMPFLDHLEELRWRILWALLALVAGMGAGFWLVTRFEVLKLLILPVQPYLGEGQKLVYLSPADPFMITLKLALVVGLLLAFPIVVYQVWAFVAPALTKSERRAIIPALYLGLVLFSGGVALAYFVGLPVSLRFFSGFQVESLQSSITAPAYLGFVVKMLLAVGVLFELPVVVLILAALGLVNAAMLRAKRRIAIVVIAVAASLITPGDIVFLTIVMMVPLLLLYELSIGLAAVVDRRRARVEAENALPDNQWVEAS